MSQKLSLQVFFLGFLIVIFFSPANQAGELTTEEMSRLLRFHDPIKVEIDRPSVSLQVEVYRTENPVPYEESNPNLEAKPSEILDIGQMILYPEEGDKLYFIFGYQNLFVAGEEKNIIHWGLKREGDRGEALAHSSFKVDVPELDAPEFDWSYGLYPGYAVSKNAFSPLYILRGLERNREVIIFHDQEKDNLNTLTQTHDVIIVINFRLD